MRLPTGVIKVESPTDYQVFQRQRWDSGTIRLRGSLMAESGQLRWRLISAAGDGKPETVLKDWQVVDVTKRQFDAGITAPAGGWYRLELRLEQDGQAVAESAVEHVGVGEVFVIAGQSNASNHGSKKQKTETGMVASFDSARWVLANDPQPGVQDGSKQGSFLPAFGDALYEKYRAPIGVASTGYGATSVRQWLPKCGNRTENYSIRGKLKPATIRSFQPLSVVHCPLWSCRMVSPEAVPRNGISFPMANLRSLSEKKSNGHRKRKRRFLGKIGVSLIWFSRQESAKI